MNNYELLQKFGFCEMYEWANVPEERLGLFVTFIFGSAFDLDNPASKNEVRKALRDMGPIENLSYNVIAGSIDDFQLTNILGSFANKPALLTSAQRMVVTSMNVITGKANMVY